MEGDLRNDKEQQTIALRKRTDIIYGLSAGFLAFAFNVIVGLSAVGWAFQNSSASIEARSRYMQQHMLVGALAPLVAGILFTILLRRTSILLGVVAGLALPLLVFGSCL